MLIDRYLPAFDATCVCDITVDAPPDVTWKAIRETDLRDPVISALFALREIPVRIARMLHGEPGPHDAGAVTFADLTTMGPNWIALGEKAGEEFVVGSVGRFWRKDYGARGVSPDRFLAFREPGFARLAVSMAVIPKGAGSLLRYEARTLATDDRARRHFMRYWFAIRFGVAVVMRRALAKIRAEAERRVRAGRAGPGIA